MRHYQLVLARALNENTIHLPAEHYAKSRGVSPMLLIGFYSGGAVADKAWVEGLSCLLESVVIAIGHVFTKKGTLKPNRLSLAF